MSDMPLGLRMDYTFGPPATECWWLRKRSSYRHAFAVRWSLHKDEEALNLVAAPGFGRTDAKAPVGLVSCV